MTAKIIIVIVLFALAVSGMVALALKEGGTEYRTIPQLTSSSYGGERVKVKAQVLSIHDQSVGKVRFTAVDIPDEDETVPPNPVIVLVTYDGDDPPQGLKMGAHVTMEGRYDADRGAFVATLLQTQCPSRYEGEKLTTANETPAP